MIVYRLIMLWSKMLHALSTVLYRLARMSRIAADHVWNWHDLAAIKADSKYPATQGEGGK